MGDPSRGHPTVLFPGCLDGYPSRGPDGVTDDAVGNWVLVVPVRMMGTSPPTGVGAYAVPYGTGLEIRRRSRVCNRNHRPISQVQYSRGCDGPDDQRRGRRCIVEVKRLLPCPCDTGDRICHHPILSCNQSFRATIRLIRMSPTALHVILRHVHQVRKPVHVENFSNVKP